ncbi:unnamed protein product [Pleuronectes platessa]|uniref:Uncharacterized protein n=1 Tax=Pleuronectes platessa TaxID=8262 RepID=A0A9N7YZD8_PLEPL|nr:unnamed protein product [Pleuronectes platessa]
MEGLHQCEASSLDPHEDKRRDRVPWRLDPAGGGDLALGSCSVVLYYILNAIKKRLQSVSSTAGGNLANAGAGDRLSPQQSAAALSHDGEIEISAAKELEYKAA